MRNVLLQAWNDFVGLVYPNLCVACREKHPIHTHMLCVSCMGTLIPTSHHLEKDNEFTERFWGRISLHAGAAMFPFVKGGRTQKMIHSLKYEGKYDIGVKMGQWYGQKLLESPLFKDIQIIVPVPIHPRKKHSRGYNQADAFAQGLAQTMQKPWSPKALKRIQHSDSQTKKSRAERLDNVLKAFAVNKANQLQGKHILLVDDVLTTGATLEACASKILEVPDTKVSLATIAISK